MQTEENKITDLFNQLPQGSYESGWSQCALFSISNTSMAHQNGIRYAISQRNWRTKDERYATGKTIIETFEAFNKLGFQKIEFETKRTHLLSFED